MVPKDESISKFGQKYYYAIQFLIFSEKRTWLKPSSLFLNFLKSDSRLLSFQFSLKRQQSSNQVVDS